MPERTDEINRLFAEGSPRLALLGRLVSVRRWPLLREALGTESPAEVIALALGQEERARRIEELAGCLAERHLFLEAEIGFRPVGGERSWAKVRDQLGTYMIGEMAAVVRRLATIGFSNIVISADHGHVMVHEIAPGDVVGKPPGEWMMAKVRSLLGRALAPGPGVVILKAGHVGI
jgi:hypothetical protein